MPKYSDLQQALGYMFHDVSLLKRALTHRSYSKDHNERLEFLGDGILDALIAYNLYKLYPDLAEGALSKMRAALVNQNALVGIASELNLGSYMLLGDGEIKNGGQYRPSIIADCLEAVIAAIFLDGGFIQVSKVVEHLFYSLLTDGEISQIKDYKTQLQEYLQAHKHPLPEYQIVATNGPEHDMRFNVECRVKELGLAATGSAKDKKQASQEAAFNLLKLFDNEFK